MTFLEFDVISLGDKCRVMINPAAITIIHADSDLDDRCLITVMGFREPIYVIESYAKVRERIIAAQQAIA